MRNRLIHGYDAVDLNLLGNTVTADLPSLIEALERILAENQGWPDGDSLGGVTRDGAPGTVPFVKPEQRVILLARVNNLFRQKSNVNPRPIRDC